MTNPSGWWPPICIDAPSDADPFAVACALDWLLYDWLMAHREDPDSAEIPRASESDAAMIVAAAAASVSVRSRFDPGLMAMPTR